MYQIGRMVFTSWVRNMEVGECLTKWEDEVQWLDFTDGLSEFKVVFMSNIYICKKWSNAMKCMHCAVMGEKHKLLLFGLLCAFNCSIFIGHPTGTKQN